MVRRELTSPSRELPAPGLPELVRWFFRRRKRFRVNGDSMRPLIADGDEVLVDVRAFYHRNPRVGDIVAAKHPYMRDVIIVKNVKSVADNGAVFLAGLNPDESTDSRAFGAIARDQIIGRVTSRFA